MNKIENDSIDTLVILNQKSGNFKALESFNYFKNNLKNNYLIFISEKKNDTFNILNLIELKNIKYVLGVGGDGTINQILETIILKNPEIILGHIPAGTGNGLAASILFQNNLDYSFENSINCINNKSIKDINVSEIEFDNKKLHSFLALSIGFISNLDINTEFLRILGSFRYYLGSIVGLYRMNSYYLEIDYLDNNNQWNSIKDRFILFWATNVSHPSYDVFISKNINYQDEYHHLILIDESISRIDMLKILLSLDQGNILDNPNVKYIKTNEYKVKVDPSENGILTIDGEMVNYQNFKVNMKKKLKILA